MSGRQQDCLKRIWERLLRTGNADGIRRVFFQDECWKILGQGRFGPARLGVDAQDETPLPVVDGCRRAAYQQRKSNMSNPTAITGPQISAVVLFQRLAPTFAVKLSHQLHRAGLKNSNDLICALTTGLRTFASAQGVCLAVDFPQAWPEALQALRGTRSEQEWEEVLAQSTAAPEAKGHILAFGAWILTAIIIAHSGPLDADISLEDLSECL